MPYHLAAIRKNKLIGAVPLYLKSNSQGEYIFDYNWAHAFERAGGRYYPEVSGVGLFNRATQALRQTGSSFKPIVYAAALEMGFSPNDLVKDEQFTIKLPGSDPWTPKNYSNVFSGEVTLTRAFSESLNIPAIKISEATSV